MRINLLQIRYTLIRTLREIYLMVFYVIKRLLVLVEFFLFLRLLLKFLNASPKALIINLIYKYSDILVLPFDFIFPDIWIEGRLIEIATISAMIGCGMAVLIVFQLLRLFSKD